MFKNTPGWLRLAVVAAALHASTAHAAPLSAESAPVLTIEAAGDPVLSQSLEPAISWPELASNPWMMCYCAVSAQVHESPITIAAANAVPEPASLALLGLAAVGLAATRRRR